MLIWACSPHQGGTTDFLAKTAARHCAGQIVQLRDYVIAPCTGCGYCANHDHCVFQDDAAALFGRLIASPVNIFIAPIYFYALPAHFKAFIDRSQIYWHRGQLPPGGRVAVILAGATRGARLFDGANLTMKYFLELLGKKPEPGLGLRGVDKPEDIAPWQLTQASELVKRIANAGQNSGLAGPD